MHRIRTGAALNVYDRGTFYCGSEQGYTDYPCMGQASHKYDLMKQSAIGTSLANAKAGGLIKRTEGDELQPDVVK